jgi:hypothetical protein
LVVSLLENIFETSNKTINQSNSIAFDNENIVDEGFNCDEYG